MKSLVLVAAALALSACGGGDSKPRLAPLYSTSSFPVGSTVRAISMPCGDLAYNVVYKVTGYWPDGRLKLMELSGYHRVYTAPTYCLQRIS